MLPLHCNSQRGAVFGAVCCKWEGDRAEAVHKAPECQSTEASSSLTGSVGPIPTGVFAVW